MLNALPQKTDRLFVGSVNSMRSNFGSQRKRTANKLKNPRLLRISFHTFRHWKATMTYHKTKDILYVKKILGHKSINSTNDVEEKTLDEQELAPVLTYIFIFFFCLAKSSYELYYRKV